VYYWDSLEALETFAADPTHREAKSQYDRWYAGYRIEIAQVLRTYGDGYYDSLDAT
jgi:heme-degrading monooxygenase HmoA